MKIRLNTEIIYNKLSNPESYVKFEDGMKEESSVPQSQIGTSLKDVASIYFSSKYVQLPLPFDNIIATFMKKEDSYSGLISLRLDEEFSQFDLEQDYPSLINLAKALKKTYKDRWVPIGPFGRGYITDEDINHPLIVIGGEGPIYNIMMGEGGTKSLELNGLDEFAGNTARLEQVSEKIMNLLYRFAPLKSPPKNLELIIRV